MSLDYTCIDPLLKAPFMALDSIDDVPDPPYALAYDALNDAPNDSYLLLQEEGEEEVYALWDQFAPPRPSPRPLTSGAGPPPAPPTLVW